MGCGSSVQATENLEDPTVELAPEVTAEALEPWFSGSREEQSARSQGLGVLLVTRLLLARTITMTTCATRTT